MKRHIYFSTSVCQADSHRRRRFFHQAAIWEAIEPIIGDETNPLSDYRLRPFSSTVMVYISHDPPVGDFFIGQIPGGK